MSYKVKRYLGFQPWGVTNPWVFANFGQPQRGRGYVSPLAYKGHPPRLGSHYLGQVDTADARAVRMERYTIASLIMGAASLGLYSYILYQNTQKKNARKRGWSTEKATSTRGLVNWRNEPAKKCYACGSTNTFRMDSTTRSCRKCGQDYAVGTKRIDQRYVAHDVRRNIGHVTSGARVHGPHGRGTVAEVHGEKASVRWDSGGPPRWISKSKLDRA